MLGLVLGLMACAALTWNAVPVAAGPAAQVTVTPRPKLTSVPVELTVKSQPRAPRLHGTLFDWGKGNMPAGVQVILSGDGWQVPVETNESGEYAFLDLGNEVAFLSAVVPDDRGDLVPLTSELPVRIDANAELIVNLALHPKDLEPDPLITLEVVSSSPEVQPEENISYAVRTVNNWDQGINQVIVAGAFGTYLDIASAMAIGMLPRLPLDRFRQVGNAAGMGARLALISRSKRAEAQDLARRVRYIELASDPGFNQIFARAMRLE